MNANGYRSDYTTSVGMAEHGWTKAAVCNLLGDPDKYAVNPHYRSGPPMRLYRVERVLAKENSCEFEEWMRGKTARKEKGKTAQARRFELFRRKYGSFRTALPDACAFLFNLNRYAKHPSCSESHRKIIYELKSEIVQVLYEQGYCTECSEHHQHMPEQTCFGCEGTGAFDLHDLNPCRRCRGTGIYKKATTFTFVSFRFSVEGTSYSWHQPDHLAIFDYDVTTQSSTWKPSEEGEKPITLSKRNFAIAKDLLRWILLETNKTTAVAA